MNIYTLFDALTHTVIWADILQAADYFGMHWAKCLLILHINCVKTSPELCTDPSSAFVTDKIIIMADKKTWSAEKFFASMAYWACSVA